MDWSKKYNVQVILNTHSLYLIQSILLSKKSLLDNGSIVLNEFSTAYTKRNELQIIKNPSYKVAYEELTLTPESFNENDPIVKVTLFCEDKVAAKFIKRILKNRDIKSYIDWQFNIKDGRTGSSVHTLDQLCNNFPIIIRKVNGLVIFDADSNPTNEFERQYIIPSLKKYPLEKELVYWILSLNPDHPFFKEMDEPIERFKQTLNLFDLPVSIKDLEADFENKKTRKFKKWFNSDLNRTNKIITRYIKYNREMFQQFELDIYKGIKDILFENGIIIREL